MAEVAAAEGMRTRYGSRTWQNWVRYVGVHIDEQGAALRSALAYYYSGDLWALTAHLFAALFRNVGRS